MKMLFISKLYGRVPNGIHRYLVKSHISTGIFNNIQYRSKQHSSGSKNSQSTLYVGPLDEAATSVLHPDLQLAERMKSLETLNDELRMRQMEFDLLELADDLKNLVMMWIKKRNLELEKKDISDTIQQSLKQGADINKSLLTEKGRLLRIELKELNHDYYSLEKDIFLQALKLPAPLHLSTLQHDTVIEEIKNNDLVPSKAKIMDHMTVGEKFGLHRAKWDPNSWYIGGELASLEQNIIHWATERIRTAGLFEWSPPDMVKSIVVEGCGYCPGNKQRHGFTLDSDNMIAENNAEFNCHDLYLTGPSLMSYAGYLMKVNIDPKHLPIHWFSVGKHYQPNSYDDLGLEKPWGLIGLPEQTHIRFYSCCSTSEENNKEVITIKDIIWTMYKSLELPMRLVHIGSCNLKIREAARYDIQIFVPSLDRHISVGYISLLGDFISRRLMTKQGKLADITSSRNYVHMMEGCVVSVPSLIAVFIELSTNDTLYEPDCIKNVDRV